jgi:hypothetical protein
MSGCAATKNAKAAKESLDGDGFTVFAVFASHDPVRVE